MSDRLKITREKLMQLPKDELVTELLGALEFVVSQHAASMHAELVAALEEAREFIAADGYRATSELLTSIDTTLQKAKQP